MATGKLIITAEDRERLEGLLESPLASVAGPSNQFHGLRAELRQAAIVPADEVPPDVVTMNSTITLRDFETNDTETYTLVYPEDADIASNRLSVLAPIGTAILGQRVGDKLRWPVPAGWRRLRIEQVIYQPERAGAFQL